MEALKDKIIEKGKILKGNIIKVDTFLNHQIDIKLMNEIGQEFYQIFKEEGVNKILTIEASGIAAAVTTAQFFNVPVVFAKKHQSLNMSKDCYECQVHSFTKKIDYNVTVSSECICENDKILIIDDFLATGNALNGLIEIINKSNAKLVGIGILIEKSFQNGGDDLRKRGIRIESLVKIKSISEMGVIFE